MTIETKYNIGDTVWLIENSKCLSGTVCGIQHNYGIGYRYGQLYSGKEFVRIQYCIDVPNRLFHYSDIEEKYLFPTKEELIKSL